MQTTKPPIVFFLVIAFATLDFPAYAEVQLWRNFSKDLNGDSPYIKPPVSPAQPWAVTYYGNPYYGDPVQFTADPANPGYGQFVSIDEYANDVLVATPASNPVFNRAQIYQSRRLGWLSQDWRADYCFSDSNGAPCYAIYNPSSPSNHVYVMSLAGGIATEGQVLDVQDYQADPINRPDQFWCRYARGPNYTLVPDP